MKDGNKRSPMPSVTPSNAFDDGDGDTDDGSDAGSLGGRSEDDGSEFDDDEYYELDEELERNTEVSASLLLSDVESTLK